MARGKKDGPSIAMRVTRNGLEPVSQYDAEVLASWRVGGIVTVQMSPANLRTTERRYRAMVGKLFKTHTVPWPNPEALHVFLKEEFGHVDVRKVDGKYTYDLRSLSAMDDDELETFFEEFCVVLHRIGVDPDTLKKESPDVGRDDPGPTRPVPDHDTTPAVDQEDEAAVAEDRPQSEATAAESDAIDREWLRTATRMLVGASQGGFDLEVLSNQAKALNQHHTPAAVSAAAKEKGNAIYKHIAKKLKAHEAPDFKVLEKLSGMKKAELTNAG